MRSSDELALVAAIADDVAAGIWVATAPEGRFVYANRAFEEIMGMGPVPEVAVGEYAQPYGIFGRDGLPYPEERMPFVQALRARATVVVDDIVIHRRDGRRVYVRATAKPMLDAAGEIAHIAIAFFDITREREAERARTEMEQRVHEVVAHAPVVLYAIDRNGVFTLSEGRALQVLVRDPGQAVGRSIFDSYPEAPSIAEHARRALAGETVSYVVEFHGAVFETRLAPRRDESGTIIGAVGVSTDVTERYRIAARLAQAERLASVGMLAAGVAHEVNNPLSYVIGNLELMAAELAAPAPRTDLLATQTRDALEGAARIRAVVRDLKSISRAEPRTRHAVDVRTTLAVSIDMARNEIRHRARLVVDLEDHLTVWADEGRLGQLFLNLLINAAQAISEGSPESNQVRVGLRRHGEGEVSIEVSDSGVGISPEARSTIFDPWFTTKPDGVGTGLGLSICHAIVTELEGRIEVDSEPGKGTTFRVFLPSHEGRPAGPTDVAAPVPTPPAPRRGRVMVVDDEPMIVKIVSALLSPEHTVVSETQARAALGRIERGERFDVILCDLMMPDVTGMDLYDRIVEIEPEQGRAVLFLTGGAFTAKAREFVARVPNETIDKPFDADELVRRVRAVVG